MRGSADPCPSERGPPWRASRTRGSSIFDVCTGNTSQNKVRLREHYTVHQFQMMVGKSKNSANFTHGWSLAQLVDREAPEWRVVGVHDSVGGVDVMSAVPVSAEVAQPHVEAGVGQDVA